MKPSHLESLSNLLRKNRETLASLERALKIPEWNEFETMGIGVLLSDVYQGVEQILKNLRGMLRYRHVQRHGYGIDLDGDRIRKNAPESAKAYMVFETHLLDKYPEIKDILSNS